MDASDQTSALPLLLQWRYGGANEQPTAALLERPGPVPPGPVKPCPKGDRDQKKLN